MKTTGVPTAPRGSAGGLSVVKIGGSVLERTPAGEAILDRVAAAWRAGDETLVVHGGGAELSRWLRRLGIDSRFVDGQRVTTADVLQVALMVLGGLVNRKLVEGLVRRGCPAVGLTGADGAGTLALPVGEVLGAVGRITTVNAGFYFDLLASRRLPVVASLAWSPGHGWLNVNADLMAAALAAGLRARRLLLMTDVDGVLDEAGSTIPLLTLRELRAIIDSGLARDGMIPKLRACHAAVEARVEEILIAPHFPGTPGDFAGTRVVAGGES
jgi:acetylglutamate kinase